MKKTTKRDHLSSAPVFTYLRDVGVTSYKPWGTFWNKLYRRHGNLAEELKDAIEEPSNGIREKVYELANFNLQLSLDVSSQYSANIYQEYLTWFDNLVLKPSSVLDIGCGNGIITCFYALKFPDASVVGIDRSPAAVACARELAQKLAISNISFAECDIATNSSMLEKYTLVVSTLCFKESATLTDAPSFSLFVMKGACPVASEVIPTLLSVDGTLITMERWGSLPQLAWWVRLLNEAGFSAEWQRSTLLSVTTDVSETLPVVVFNNKQPVHIATEQEVLSFRASSQLIKSQPIYEDLAAEAFFRALGPKQLIRGVEASYLNGSGTERFELWKADALLLSYMYSNRGYRRLAIGPTTALGEADKLLDSFAQEKGIHAKVTLYSERDLSGSTGAIGVKSNPPIELPSC
jgi:SAM-dependent methyltransferase